MEEKAPPAGGSLGRTFSDAAMDLDLINELLSVDCIDLLRSGTSAPTSPFGSSALSPVFGFGNDTSSQLPQGNSRQNDVGASVFHFALPTDGAEVDKLGERQPLQLSKYLDMRNPSFEPGMSWCIPPAGAMATIQERLAHALRIISTRYQFLADENSHEAVGLPGRVFLCKLPEWSPDVQFFTSQEYPRVSDAQRFGVRGTIALPIFERVNRNCLGVLEVVMTTQKINYSSDLENICDALQAVDLLSSQVSNVPRILAGTSYQAALQIQGVLRAVCGTHRLPLAQTWISFIQQGKSGRRHSDENYKDCVSTIDTACHIQDTNVLDFHNACSEHHLLRDQGIVGKAFMTNEPCFSSDVTAFSKSEYPLSHHAKLFNLKAAVAIRLRSIRTEKADFVLELFLPITCAEGEEQKVMLTSLSNTLQRICQSLRVLTDKELEDEVSLESNVLMQKKTSCNAFSDIGQGSLPDELISVGLLEEISDMFPSCTSNMRIAQQKEADNALLTYIPLGSSEQRVENFGVLMHWDPLDAEIPNGNIFSESNQHLYDTDQINSFSCEPSISNVERTTEKKRAKAEKVINLQELRKYFAGSLKDAAKSLGVCPTTLKRICRQHGIARWPSRKIKKVGHSLKKLQIVIDTVHGPEGAFQLSSFYENFTRTTWSDNDTATVSTMSTSLREDNRPGPSNANQQIEVRFNSHTSKSNSLSSSSCSQSSCSNLGCSSGHKLSCAIGTKQESLEENQISIFKKVHSLTELHVPHEEAPKSVVRSQSHKFLTDYHLTGSGRSNFIKVKAIYGDEKVIFRLQPSWSFQELIHEIKKRFSIGDATLVDLKYLDDDSEWVLLTCESDLEECIDVYKSSNAHTIKISVHVAHETTRSSFVDTGVS